MQQFFQSYRSTFSNYVFSVVQQFGVIFWVHFKVGMGVLAFGLVAVSAAIAFTYWQIRAFMAGEKSRDSK